MEKRSLNAAKIGMNCNTNIIIVISVFQEIGHVGGEDSNGTMTDPLF